MTIRNDLYRFEQIGQDRRMDLADFIREGELQTPDGSIDVPLKMIELPEFVYDRRQKGGVGQAVDADPSQGDPVKVPEDDDGGESDEGEDDGDPGDEEGEHGYYEMDPEEFARELDEEMDLDLEPKGKKVVDTVEGDFTDMSRTGPDSTLDVEYLFKEGLKRTIAMRFDEDYLRKVMQVDGMDPGDVFEWARMRSVPVSREWIEREYEQIEETDVYDSVDDIPGSLDRYPAIGAVEDVSIRRDDERYRYPEIIEKKERNVVVVNIRDVSGSMRRKKRDLVERTLTPLDWYLQGKYDNADFRYIAHDAEAWEVPRLDFFGIRSGGGTRISSAYELAKEILDEQYPWSEWNRYVFAAGDSENGGDDTRNNVIPLMEEIDANLHAYVETRRKASAMAQHAETVEDYFGDDGNVVVARVSSRDDVVPAIEKILNASSDSA